MAQSKSAEEVHAEHISVLGSALGGAYHALYNEVAWLHIKWNQYRTLFGTSPARIALLNEAAPLFFRLLQDSLWEDTLLHLSRLTDSVQSMGKQNLTVKRLPHLVPDLVLRAEVQSLVDDAVSKSEFARDWRNRHIAHRDLALALHEPARELPAASRTGVSEAIGSLAAVLNRLHSHYLGSTIVFDFGGDPGDATSLLSVLRDGTQLRRHRLKRLEEGRPTAEDLAPRPPI